jgi:hypothetical protein
MGLIAMWSNGPLHQVEKQCHATKYLQAKSPVENKIHQMYIFMI